MKEIKNKDIQELAEGIRDAVFYDKYDAHYVADLIKDFLDDNKIEREK